MFACSRLLSNFEMHSLFKFELLESRFENVCIKKLQLTPIYYLHGIVTCLFFTEHDWL